MSTAISYTATLRTRNKNSTSSKTGRATQEFYSSGDNYAGIILFSGMNLTGKVITGIQLTVTSSSSGYGASSSKTVYMNKARYQNSIVDGVTGSGYVGDALGTFSGSFYNNTTTNTITGALLTAMGDYISQGNNAFVIYNPSPRTSSQGWSTNYLQWTSVTMTVTYDEAVSVPSTSASSVNLGSAVTIYTNRASSSTVHTITYAFGNTTGTIGSNIGASVSWAPPLTLASQIPNAVSGICTIICVSYNGGVQTGSRSVGITLTIPSTVVPEISSVTISDTNSTVVEKIGSYVKLLSRPQVSITAAGVYGSTISAYRTVLDGVTYTTASFTTSKVLSKSGEVTLSVTVTDSRGRTVTYSTSITALDYSYPSITQFKCERCNTNGSAAQVDGTHVRYTFSGSVAPLGNKNGVACLVFYKLSSASAWVRAETMPISAYNITATNKVMEQEFELLSSYDLKVQLQDYFYAVAQSVSIGTKTVIMDFLSDGTGIGIGKVAETSGYCEIGWPLSLSTPLAVSEGGTGANTAVGACNAIGAVKKGGDAMTGDLTIITQVNPGLVLQPFYNDTTNLGKVEGTYAGSCSIAAWDDSTGNNRRAIEVRDKTLEASLNNAALLQVTDGGATSYYRLYHEGQGFGIPVGKGGTGSTTAAGARTNLGCDDASNLSSGTVAMARLPFKVAYGSGSVAGNSALSIDYTNAGFTSVPCIVASYSTTGSNWSGDNGALKIHSKTTTGATIIVGGSFNTKRQIDWVAVGV